jgi:hypothetical protein
MSVSGRNDMSLSRNAMSDMPTEELNVLQSDRVLLSDLDSCEVDQQESAQKMQAVRLHHLSRNAMSDMPTEELNGLSPDKDIRSHLLSRNSMSAVHTEELNFLSPNRDAKSDLYGKLQTYI